MENREWDKGANIIFVVLLIIVLGLLLTTKEENTNEYYRSAEVFRIENEVVYLEDTQGYVWCVEDDTLQKYGRYVLVMDSCGTDDITDDVILQVE